SSPPVPAPSTSPPVCLRNANFSGLVSNATKYTCTPPSLFRQISRATASGSRPRVFSPSVTTRRYLRKTPARYRSGRAVASASPIAVPPPGRGTVSSALRTASRSYGWIGRSTRTLLAKLYRPILIGKSGRFAMNASVASTIARRASCATTYLGRVSPGAVSPMDPDVSTRIATAAPSPSSTSAWYGADASAGSARFAGAVPWPGDGPQAASHVSASAAASDAVVPAASLDALGTP